MFIQLHEVSAGETLTGIARQYGVPLSAVKALNRLISAKLAPGERLLIRVLDEEAIPQSYDEPLRQVAARDLERPGIKIYVVKPGDTLYRIHRDQNVSLEQLMQDNGLGSKTIYPGQELKIRQNWGPVQPVSQEKMQYHTVAQGETLTSIAKRYDMTVSALMHLNRRTDHRIWPGNRLIVRIHEGGNAYPPKEEKPAPYADPQVNTRPAPPSQGVMRENARHLIFEFNIPSIGAYEAPVEKVPGGYRYFGHAKRVLSVSRMLPLLRAIGISDQIARALEFTRAVEGDYDAINTHDGGKFSYGFAQFTAKYTILDKLLQSMKQYAPVPFRNIFEEKGISAQGLLQVRTDQGSWLQGEHAWNYLRSQPRLLEPFIRAGLEPELVREQYRVANEEYVNKASRAVIPITLPDGSSLQKPLFELFPQIELQALIIAMAINLGQNGMTNVLRDVLGSLARSYNLRSAQHFAQISYRDVCQHLISFENDQIRRGNSAGRKSELTIKRAERMLQGGIGEIA